MSVAEPNDEAGERGAHWLAVAVNRPFAEPLTYRLPAGWSPPDRGALVAVPLGQREAIGVVVDFPAEPGCDPSRVRPIRRVMERSGTLPEALLDLGLWMAGYYLCAPGEALAACLSPGARTGQRRRLEYSVRLVDAPATEERATLERRAAAQFRALRSLDEAGGALLLKDLMRHASIGRGVVRALEAKGWVVLDEHESELESGRRTVRASAPQLSAAQRAALEPITRAVETGGYAPFLLYGVTGSGKTEIYLEAIRLALEKGRSAIFLVPEIALTPQTTARLEERFDDVAVLHSGLTDRMRDRYWASIRSGEVRLVVGARSAILAPVVELGVVIVDEEHEPSFKQQSTPRYHARDVAVYRAYREGAVVVLGSATPSLESWHNAHEGKYHLLELRERVPGRSLPRVELVDLRNEQVERRGEVVLSTALRTSIHEALATGNQVLLLQNRRGYAPILFCPVCASAVSCRQCDVTLTVHRRRNRAVCHQCSEELPASTRCPDCDGDSLVLLGLGSERVEESLALEFPTARILRMDSDTMMSRDAYQQVYEDMGAGKIDILVGTQMVAKGFDFPGVTVVGVVQADTSLCIPDFRSAERTFQLISQVAGRSGRGAEEGLVFVQSMEPEQAAIRSAAEHDFVGFAGGELGDRQRYRYPPFARMVRIQLEGAREARVDEAARAVRDLLEPAVRRHDELILQGPAPAVIRRVRGRSRSQLSVRAIPPQALRWIRPQLASLARSFPGGVRVDIDVDPVGAW